MSRSSAELYENDDGNECEDSRTSHIDLCEVEFVLNIFLISGHSTNVFLSFINYYNYIITRAQAHSPHSRLSSRWFGPGVYIFGPEGSDGFDLGILWLKPWGLDGMDLGDWMARTLSLLWLGPRLLRPQDQVAWTLGLMVWTLGIGCGLDLGDLGLDGI